MKDSHREPMVHFARVNRQLARPMGLVCQYFDHVQLSKATLFVVVANQLTFWGPGRAWHPLAVCAKLGGCTKGVLFVPRGYTTYIRYECCLF
jgi:hypothetical protein